MSSRNNSKARILMGKAGLDGHDRGVKVVSRALMDAGYEVVYTGVHLSPGDIVKSAADNDVDAIGISILSGAHMHIFSEVLKNLESEGMTDIPVFGGGVIPREDVESLKKMGVREIFLPGTPLENIVNWIGDNVRSANCRHSSL